MSSLRTIISSNPVLLLTAVDGCCGKGRERLRVCVRACVWMCACVQLSGSGEKYGRCKEGRCFLLFLLSLSLSLQSHERCHRMLFVVVIILYRCCHPLSLSPVPANFFLPFLCMDNAAVLSCRCPFLSLWPHCVCEMTSGRTLLRNGMVLKLKLLCEINYAPG